MGVGEGAPQALRRRDKGQGGRGSPAEEARTRGEASYGRCLSDSIRAPRAFPDFDRIWSSAAALAPWPQKGGRSAILGMLHVHACLDPVDAVATRGRRGSAIGYDHR